MLSITLCSGEDVLESGLREAGTVIRRSTTWSRGTPRVCYAFVLVYRGEARPTAVSVCEPCMKGVADEETRVGVEDEASNGGGGGDRRRRMRRAATAKR
ncbi:hypothetical protein Scep_028181 [Stephania cephalantha]|uniref:Uncharacterized protein n=1 Tax=Stephania cephalantha TaxID=152367 RepID=A0AAP0HJA9_9MAGN